MGGLTIHQDRCKACGFCIHFCPRQVLGASKTTINGKGFAPVEAVRGGCIECGVCHTVCPDCVFELDTTDAD
ncbi:MAG: 4Fe-4S binding protein [Clostridiales Family XIII bacterium]|jgi:2-oxoglutarate ferredoxin oxidoreductase subunit delta|nr:4Fe-4S binding protein [Clostridiales Family XIII bacterium]